MHSRYADFVRGYPGIKEIDYFLARSVVSALNREGDTLLFFSVVACSESLREGHSCLQLNDWAGSRHWYNEAGDDETSGYTFPELLAWQQHLCTASISPASAHPIVYENARLYLRRYWQFEDELSNAIKGFSQSLIYDTTKANAILSALFSQGNQKDTEIDWQKVSAANAIGKQFSIVTGGPGTGKTTTVTKLLIALCEVYDEPFSIKMVAPTGKAAQRLTESIANAKALLKPDHDLPESTWSSIPDEAMTIHRLLGVIPHHHQFRFNESNRLKLDILLVDEASMVDLPLMARLFRALPDHARVILLGDSNQLPSVAAGSVLADIAPSPHPGYSERNAESLEQLTGYPVPVAKSEAIDCLTHLSRSYRFKDSGGIGQLAKSVIGGDVDSSWTLLNGDDSEVRLSQETNFSCWLRQLTEQFYSNIAQSSDVAVALEQFSSFRLLAATRVGDRGVDAINAEIDRVIKRQLGIPLSKRFYHGCPIMITQNNYETGVFNGDIGMIWRHEDRLQAAFPGMGAEIRWLSLSRLPSFELVYAMTIHKTQGSEFDHVAIAMPHQHLPILSRELIYTGLTRAKSALEINCQKSVWGKTVKRRVSRNSGLFDKLYRDVVQISLI
ncbi:exodeoxyribonuclease V subunit alpha [Alkalimarinus coralli]|uniref:exodeoxyribonuclease V subunit alpha n=1 Tax=Alkalimarinus coralli TaxID=2935863 RepID=UPI00202B5CE1|nr:exodeoxyribonuclease V subunit alpha [Alkalimarinus coralli]